MLMILRVFMLPLLGLRPRSTLFPYTTLFRSTVIISDFAIRRPVITVVTMVALVVFGLVGLYQSEDHQGQDRKSTRLNSSHRTISYAVFCLKKKKYIR